MYRIVPYSILFAVTVLLQVFLFDNLSISVYINPLIYIAFIILLPLEIPAVALLLLGLVTGLTMDWFMGTAGLNVIATLPLAFMRPFILNWFSGRDDGREEGVPSVGKLGRRVFLSYLIVAIVLHHTLFFVFEALSWAHIPFTLLKILLSSAVSLAFVWIIARLFTSKFSARI